MKALIFSLFISQFSYASIMGSTDIFKPESPSELLMSLERYRACEGDLHGSPQVEKLLESLVRMNSSESVYIEQVRSRLLRAIQIHPEALSFVNAYLAYANEAFFQQPEEIKTELQRTREFREATTRLTADLPVTLHLSAQVKLLNGMLLAIWKDPRLMSNRAFLYEVAHEVSRWNSRDVRMTLEYEAQARLASAGLIAKLHKWRQENDFNIDIHALSDLAKTWETLILASSSGN